MPQVRPGHGPFYHNAAETWSKFRLLRCALSLRFWVGSTLPSYQKLQRFCTTTHEDALDTPFNCPVDASESNMQAYYERRRRCFKS